MILSLAMVSTAAAFGERVHEALTEAALRSTVGAAQVAPARPEEAAALLAEIDGWARGSRHAAAWTARYPESAAFDAWAFKELLSLNPEASVVGLDRFDTADTLLAALAQGSRRPDDDGRNRERRAHGPDRAALPGVPDDPILLNMGRLGSVSSQAHAHYALQRGEFSDDPEVLRTQPERFAVAAGWPEGPIITLAPEMAQAHADLATLAFLAGHDGLGACWFGAALHYAEDVGTPIHTVQVGLYDFFKDAWFTRLGLGARTGGGYFGELPTLASVGMNSITNHHLLGELITEQALLLGEEGLLDAARSDAPDMAPVTAVPDSPTAVRDSVVALIGISAPHAADTYARTRALVDPRFREPGASYTEAKGDPASAIREDATPAEREAFFLEQRDALSRAGTSVRALWRREADQLAVARSDPEAAARLRASTMESLVGNALAARAEVEARRARYLANPPVPAPSGSRMPAMLAAELVLSAGLGWGLSRFFRRPRPRN